MSMYGSQQGLNMGRRVSSKGDLAGGGSYHYARSEVVHGGGNGYDPYMDGYKTYTFSKSTGMGGGMGSGTMSGVMSQMASGMEGGTMSRMSGSAFGAINQRAEALQSQCNEYLKKADYAMQSGSGDTEYYMGMARDAIEKLKYCAMDLRQMGQPNDNVIRSLEICKDRLKGAHMAMTSSMQRRRSTRGSSGGWEDPGRSFHDAMAWIGQHKRLIETAPWGDDPAAIEQQLISHQKFHASIQRSPEMDRARDELAKKGDKGSLHALEQEWDSLQQMSFGRTQQLRDLLHLIQEISREIMWVNDREEEELMFDWGDKNVDHYIPKKQESYSNLMSALEDKEMELNKLKAKVDNVLKNNHPAADKIEAYKDTLQTQWSWLLQITKCIDVHLKENGAYSQFFKEANDTYSALQKEHETVRKKFPCDKSTSLENLLELLRGLERERDKIMENKRQVQHLVNRSKSIVRLKPRNPEEKSNHSVIVKALCDFKQDQKVICKDNEAILKDNSQRSKWQVTGPGGLDMLVPSVCLIVPPPNPLSISLANKNEQYYEAILSIWNQLYINVKSLIAWQYCLLDIRRINSLTINMLATMRPEEYRQIIKSLETHYEEFKLSSHGSQMFADEDKRSIENQFTGAQAHYDQLVVQLPAYVAQQEQIEIQQVVEQPRHQFIIIQQQQQVQQDAAEEEARMLEEERQRLEIKKIAERKAAAELEARRIEEERRRLEIKKIAERKAAAELEARRIEEERRSVEFKKIEKKAEVKKEVVSKDHVVKKEIVKVVRTEPVRRKVSSSSVSTASSSSRSLSELHSLRLRLETAEGMLSQHLHVCFGEDAVHDCGLKIIQLETVQRDVDAMRDEYLSLRERILRELEGMSDSDKAQFLRSEVGVINQRLGSLESSSSAYVQRLRALRDMLESVARAEDIVKVHEARLTEKETTSLSPEEVDEYMVTLKTVKAELDQKKDVLASMERELTKASHWNSQVGDPFHRCDMMLSKYTEQVGVLSDRWRRIQGQIDTRLQDLQLYVPQLQHYKQTSTSLFDWIDTTTKKQNALQATKIETVQALKDHITNQKALNTEIKAKRETVERVLKDNEACVNVIKDYETDLSSYTSGLETLLNVPIKRTMLRSPSMDLNQEAVQLQTRYMELLTISGDYHKFLGESLKNMEELKIRNTRIDLLEEELRLLREDIQDCNGRNKSLEDTVARYQLELSQSQEQLLSVEEVKRNTALQCNATKESLDSTQSQLTELSDQVTRLKYLLEEEKRKRKLAEERYNQQQEEYESVLRKRQNELETVSWSKMDVEKSVANKDHEIENLRRQLDAETARVKELQTDLSKVRSQCSMEINNLKLSYESQIHISRTDIQRLAAQRDEDTAELQMQYDRMEAERRNLEDDVRRLRMSINQAEEQRMRLEDEAQSQRAVIVEEGRRRRELESQVELLMSQRDEESSEYREELAELMNTLQEKSDQLAYVTHSLDEENRRRKTIEEGQAVLEQTVTQLQVKLTSSSVATTQLREYDEELQKMCLELERESKERSRVEQNVSRLNSRIKDLQTVRDELESQVENLRIANQEEVARRMHVEAELEKTTVNMTDYATTITALRKSQEQASTSEKRVEEERLRLQEELERSLRQNKTSAGHMTQLSTELKTMQQQLLQEQARLKEAKLRNDGLYRTIEEKSKAQNENTVQLKSLKEITETQTKERLRLEEELKAAHHEKEELLRAKQGSDAELKTSAECMTQLSTELKAMQQQLLQEQARLKEAKLRNDGLYRTIEEKSKVLNENTVQLDSLKEITETQTKERLRLEEELRAAHHEKEELLRAKQGSDDELKTSAECMTQLSTELKAMQQQLLQEQARLKEAKLRNDGLYRTIEEKSKAQNENTVQLEGLKEITETQTKERLKLEKELKAAHHEKEELLRAKQGSDDKLKTSAECMTQMSTELKAMQQQLLQEQARLKEAKLRNDGLYRTIEEKSKALNENTVQLEGLKEITETQTKERLRLKEELKAAHHEKEELLRAKQGNDAELSSQITALELQLQASERSNKDYHSLVSELSSEREKLKLEAENIQTQATETRAMMQSLQSQHDDVVKERDAELRNKQRLQEENERVKRDLSYWKDQCDSKQGMIRQYDTDKEILEREKKSLKSEIERLMRELKDLDDTNKSRLSAIQREMKEVSVRQTKETELKTTRAPPILETSTAIFDGVRKPVTANQLLDCGVLDKPTFNQLMKGHKTVPEVSVDKKVNLKGTGPIAGVVIESPKSPGSMMRPLCKMTFTEAKKDNLLPQDSVDLLLDAQAATGHIIDPRTNQKLTVEEACNQGVVDDEDRERLLAAEAAAVGFRGPGTSKPLSVFQAMKKGLIDKTTTLRLLQAQEATGGILDPINSVFLPKDTAIERDLIDDTICRALSKRPELYLDPENEEGVSYSAMKRRCRVDPDTGLLLLPIPEKVDPSKLVFDGVRKPVTANQLLDCGVLDKPTFKDLEKGKKTVPEVSEDKKVSLKGTGPIAGVVAGSKGKMSFTQAKKQMLLSDDSADLLLEAQAATGHIIDPKTNQKLTVEEACAKGVVDVTDEDKLLAAEAAAIGYKDPNVAKPLSVFEAMKKGLIEKETAVRLLQAQVSTGGILDPILSVFLPKDTAIKRKIFDENLHNALSQSPSCYLDPETEQEASYEALKKRCKIEPHTGLLLLPITEKLDPSKLIFDGVRKPVTAQQLLDCGVLDKPTVTQLMKGEKSVPEVSEDKKISLKGKGSIAGVAAGPSGKMSFSEAKEKMLITPDSADLLLEAQAATGHIIDPTSNQKLTVEEACARGVVDNKDQDKLLAAESAAVGYGDPNTAKPLSVFEAMKKGMIDRNTGVRLLQAQEVAGGILDPNLSVFLPKDTAIKRNILDEDLCRALNKDPRCYLDPDTERDTSYGALKKRCKTEPRTGLMFLPITERKDPTKLMFDGVRKPVSAQNLFECGVLDKPTFNQLTKGEKTVPEVSEDKKVNLKGTGPIAGIVAGRQGKMSLSEAKKQMLLSDDSADLLLEAQAATGHIIDPKTDEKLTVKEACAKGVVDIRDQDKLLAAEAAAIGYKDPRAAKPLSVFEAMKKGLIEKETAVRLLQAQVSTGGILDPILSVFLPEDTAIKRNLFDENLRRALNQSPSCYLDPETEQEASYEALKKRCKTEPHTGLLLLPITEKVDPSKLIFDGVRKPVTAQQLLDCGVLDKPTVTKLMKGEKSVPEVSEDKKLFLKGKGSIAGVAAGPSGKMSFTDAKKKMLMPPDSADLLLEAQAATGHIIDPTSNQKLTVEEACARGVVDNKDRDKLLAAESAAVGYGDPNTAKPLSVFEAMKKGMIDRNTGIRLLQAQEVAGGILDPNLSVFLPKDTAIKRKLLDEDLCRELNKDPQCYLDPDTDRDASYGALKKRCNTEPHTDLMLLPITERKDPTKLMFDGVRKPVSAQQLFECGVLDKPTFNQLTKGEKTVPEVSEDKKVNLKGTGPIAGIVAGRQGKMSLSEAKKQMLLSDDSADLLLEAQAATGHIIDPKTDEKLTVKEACAKGVVDIRDQDKLLAAEAAAIGYKDPRAAKPLSVFEAMKKGLIEKETAVRLLQAQVSSGGILDPILSVFLPEDTAIKRNLLDEDLSRALNQSPECYHDPETEQKASYEALKKRCKTEPHTGLLLLPITEKVDPSKLIFDGVRKPVTAQQLLDCGVLDKPTVTQLMKGEKTVPEVSEDKKISLKGKGSIAGVEAGPFGKMSFSEAKKKMLMPPDSADLLLEAQAATGHIIDPTSNQKLTVEEACARGVVDNKDRDKLLAAESAAVGYEDPNTAKPLSVFEAMKKGMIDRNTGVRLLQAQEVAGGILDPNLSVFLPKDTAIKRKILDEDLCRELNKDPQCYLDPDTERDASYGALKKRCNTEPRTGLMLLPITERKDPTKLMFDGVRKPVSAQQLFECGVLDKPTFNQLMKGEKTVPEVSEDKKANLKGTGPIAGIVAGRQGKMSLSEAKKQMLLSDDSADLLLEAQAATGHIIDPKTDEKLTVKEACAKGVVDIRDQDKLLAAEAAAIGYKDPRAAKPLSVFEAMKKGLIEKETAVRLLQAQVSSGGILDPNLSVFLPEDTAIKRNLLDENLRRALNQSPECYHDPETEQKTSYEALKKKSKTEPHTGLLILPITEKLDPSRLIFDGVRKPVTAQQLLDCGVLDKPTVTQLMKGEKTVPEVSEDKKANLKGTGPIAGIVAGRQGKMSLSEAKKQNLLPEDCADLLLEAQAATGHIIDPKTGQKLKVEEACAKGVVDRRDRDRLLAAEAAAIGYKDPRAAKPLSVFEAMKKGLIEKETAVRFLQVQVSSGGILDPNLSVFLPEDTAIKRNLLDENLSRALNQSPECYHDPEAEQKASYEALKKKCKTEPHTGLLLLPITEKLDPSKMIFDGVRKPVTAQQLLDCGVLDKPTVTQLMKGEKTVPEVSEDKKAFLKGAGSIAGVAAGPSGKMSLSEAKKKMLMPPDSADLLLEAQAATGHIIDPTSNQKLTVEEACARGVVDNKDQDKLLAAERAAVGYGDPNTAKPLSVFEAMKKGMIDRNTGIRLLQAQEAAGGILDPNLSVFLPKDTAIRRNLLDGDVCRELNKDPQCYLDPDTERDTSYGALKKRCKTEPRTGLILLPITERKDPTKLMFDGVRKPVPAQQLFECGVLDKPTFNQLTKGQKTVPEVSEDKKANLKGTGPIAGIVAGRQGKMSLSEAKKQNLLPEDCADLLLEAQAATGHIIDPKTGQKLKVEEACAKGVVDRKDRDRLLAAEAAAIGFKDPRAAKPLSVFEAMKKGLIEKETAVRLLQAQVSTGGILDPNLSVFVPEDTAIKRNLLDENLRRALNQSPACYIDPETKCSASYEALKKKCKTEPHSGILLLPVTEQLDPSKLIFDGVRKPVTAQQLLDCGVLDKPTVTQLMKGEKTVPEVSKDKKAFLKGTGSIAGVAAGPLGKMSLSEAKKKMLMPPDSADLLLEAQAATGHIIDPTSNQKLTVEEACVKGVVDNKDRDKLLAAERAAVGYGDPNTAKPLSVFEAMKKGMIDRNTGIRLLQSQEVAGGILDPNLSVFLPKDTAIKRKLLDEDLCRALNKDPQCYLDPDTDRDASYGALKKRCKTESHTGLMLLPITERKDPTKLMFDGVRKPVSAQQLFECGVLDKPTFNQLTKGEKTVPEVSEDKKVFLKGTGPIAGVVAGRQGKMSLSEAKKQNLLPQDCADLLLEAQAATGNITDPKTGQKLTVEEACAKGVVDRKDRDRLLAAEAAAIGFKDPRAAKPLSVFEAMKKGLIEKETAVRLLQAQVSSGGILDPNLSVFLPEDTAIKRNLLDENLSRALNQSPACYLDPETKCSTSYEALKKKCKTEPHSGLLLLPVTEQLDPSKLIFDGVRKPVTAQQLLDCGVLDKPTVTQLMKGEKTVPEVSEDKKIFLKGKGSIAGVTAGPLGKMSLSEAKKNMLVPADSADLLLEAQVAAGHIIDPTSNQKLTVEEACARGVVDNKDRDKLLAAERAAVGYGDPNTAKPLSVFEAMKKGMIDRNTGVRLLQAQEVAGGILDPNLSVFLPKDTAIKRKLLDEDLCRELNKDPQCYLDPDTERLTSYGALKKRCNTEPRTGLMLLPITERKDPTKLMFDGVRKPVSAQQLFECGVLDKPTFNQLTKGQKTVPEVSEDKKANLKGTGPIAGIVAGRQGKMSLSEAKKQMLLPEDCADLLLDAQAATGNITDPKTGQKLTVEEACAKGVVDRKDRDRLLAAEAAAIGYKDPRAAKPLSVFEAMKKGLIEKEAAVRLLQAQVSSGGILDPNLSVFVPKDTAIKRNLLDENLSRALNQSPACYLDPETKCSTSYEALKKKCKTEPHSGLLLLPVTEQLDPSKLIFDGVRKPVTAQQLLDCGVLDKPTVTQLMKGEKTVPEVSEDKKAFLKGAGSIAGVAAGPSGKMSLSEAKKKMLMPPDSADLLLEAQAATGHIIDPTSNQKLTVEEACARGVVDNKDRDKLLAAERAAVGYGSTAKPLSVFEAMKKGMIDRNTGVRLLQAQEVAGGILDPNLSVFLPKDAAIKRNLLDEDLCRALNKDAQCYLDPDTERDTSYGALKKRCKTEPRTGLILLPITERKDPTKLMFDGVRKPVSAQQLFECGVLDKLTFTQLVKGEKTIPEVSLDKKVFLKGTGSVAGIAAGPLRKMSFTEAKKQKIMAPASADLLLDAQAATGHIIDPRTNQKLTVKEACALGVVNKEDASKLFAAEAAAIGYREPHTAKLLSAGQAMKKGMIDKDTALRVLQAQECVGGILDPSISIFVPKDIAKEKDLIDENLYHALNQCPECYLDPDTQQKTTYVSLKKKCKVDPSTGLLLFPEPKKAVTVQGIRDQVSVIDLVDANLLKQSDVDQLREGRLTNQDIEDRLSSYLGGSTCIAGVYDEASDKVLPIYEAMKEELLPRGTTVELLEAQAASGFIVDPVNNLYLTVSDAYSRGLFGPEFKDKLLAAEMAVTGYKLPGADSILSLFQAIERGLVERGQGLRLLQAQIASGGIIDPIHGHRIDANIAHKRGYFDDKMNNILANEKGFFDPNTEENLTYLELKKRCKTDKKTGLILLPINEKTKQRTVQKNTRGKRRVVIVDPETNEDMTVRQAFDKGYIDYLTYLELSKQECEWEEVTSTHPDGSSQCIIIDRKTGREYNVTELLKKQVISQSDLQRYRSQILTLTQFADFIISKTAHGSPSLSSSSSSSSSSSLLSSSTTSRPSAASGTSSVTSTLTSTLSTSLGTSSVTSSTLRTSEASFPSSLKSSSSVMSRPLSPTLAKVTTTKTTTITERSSTSSRGVRDSPDSFKHISSISVNLETPDEIVGEQEPVGAIFDTDNVEKISITEALNRDLVDSITAQRLLEAQACTGGIVNPANGQRLSIQEALRMGLIDDDMATKLKPAQKAFIGFEDVKTRKKMSAAQALKERWLPYEAGQRFMEFQVVTGGLYDPEVGCRRTIEDALKMGWLDERTAQKLQDMKHHAKILTCPKSKLNISYKDALDNCLVEERTGLKILQASSVSSRGISSPYNVASAPGSTTGSRSGSRRSSRRASLDLGSPTSSTTSRYNPTSVTSFPFHT